MSNTGWSTERIAEQYRAEIRAKFEAENAAWRADEIEGIERCRITDREYADSLAVCDSFMWNIYSNSEIQIDMNSVRAVLPNGFAIFSDLIEMFEGSSVGWTRADVGAEIIDGEARVVIDLLLVDYHDDERAAEWERQHPKQSPIDKLLEGPEIPVENVEMSPQMIAALLMDNG